MKGNPMRIAMVGTGYVGLVSGTCFAEFGMQVHCVDKDAEKIAQLRKGKIPIYEPGLEALLEKQIMAGRISFTDDLKDAVKSADAVFIAVGTPGRRSGGQADLSQVYQAAREVAQVIEGYTVIVTKSTVPVGTAREVERIIREARPDASFDVASNPEFLREGAAVEDFMRPDRVVIGTSAQRAQEVLREIYRPLYINETPIVFTRRETAEIIKYAANAFLATKITFINEVADLCEKAGADVQVVAKALGLDGRIGAKFLHAGPGYGGSCFPKDTVALVQTGAQFGAPQTIVDAVVKANEQRKQAMAARIIAACGGDVKGKKIAVFGVAFKPNTDDVRDAPSLSIIPILQAQGAVISAYDPAAMVEAAKRLPDVQWQQEPYATVEDADALVILTEWNEFRGLDMARIGAAMKTRCLLDLRNVYKPDTMDALGFHYISIGRAEVRPAKKAALREVAGN